MYKRSGLIAVLPALLLSASLLSGCSTPAVSEDVSEDPAADATVSASASAASGGTSAGSADSDDASGEYKTTATAEIKIEGHDPIVVDLYGDVAPKTVENFIDLAKSGFYDGLTFHRIMDGFMMQGGDPLGNGMGGSDKNVEGEFSANGVDNPITHTRGAISMARSQDPNSASSQFFIVQSDSQFLDGQYAAFGYVRDGMEVVDEICAAAQPTDNNGTISADQQPVIESITITEA